MKASKIFENIIRAALVASCAAVVTTLHPYVYYNIIVNNLFIILMLAGGIVIGSGSTIGLMLAYAFIVAGTAFLAYKLPYSINPGFYAMGALLAIMAAWACFRFFKQPYHIITTYSRKKFHDWPFSLALALLSLAIGITLLSVAPLTLNVMFLGALPAVVLFIYAIINMNMAIHTEPQYGLTPDSDNFIKTDEDYEYISLSSLAQYFMIGAIVNSVAP